MPDETVPPTDATPCHTVSGLAIAALTLAFLAVLGGLTAPLAFALGIVVLWRARRDGPRLDPAFGVVTMAVAVLAGGLGVGVALAGHHQLTGGRLLRCQGHVERIGDALVDYAEDHGAQLPAPKSDDELQRLLAPYLQGADDDLWTCPTRARYILNPDVAGWYLDELDRDFDILVYETFDGHEMAFPHHGFGWPRCGMFYFADGTVDWLAPEDIDHGDPGDGFMLPDAATPQPL